jgi:hypothetical protein
MTKKSDLMNDARHHYFASEQPKGSALLSYTNGYQKGFQMAIREVGWILDRRSNNIDRIAALRELIKEVGK